MNRFQNKKNANNLQYRCKEYGMLLVETTCKSFFNVFTYLRN